VFRIRIRFLRIRNQGFFLNPDPDPGKEKTFRNAIQKKFGGSYQYGTNWLDDRQTNTQTSQPSPPQANTDCSTVRYLKVYTVR